MPTLRLLFVLLIFISIYQLSYSMNSYIYLPDKLIQEEIPIGSLIIDLSDELNNNNNNRNRDTKFQNSIAIQNQQFTFLEDAKQPSDNTYFLIDSITGRITTKRYLDRESMCMNKHCSEPCEVGNIRGNCKINLKILLIPSYNIISLNIIVQDINDNQPQFPTDFINQSIPENVPIGYKIPIDLAYDADAGINSVQYYAFVDSPNNSNIDLVNETFDLVQNLFESQLTLIVKTKLDRENISSYRFTIAAYDGGTPPFSGKLQFNLEITDINDNNPKFKQETYKFSVLENTPIGSQIGERVEAYDLDDGINGMIKYSLVNTGIGQMASTDTLIGAGVSHQDFMKLFELNPDTGILTLKGELDYETENYYSLTVEARDCGFGSLPAYATIEIFIIDCNDNAPEISVSFLNTLYKNNSLVNNLTTVYLPENMLPNKYIAHVSMFDKDSNENGRIDWKLFINEREMRFDDNKLILINKLNNNSFTINSGLNSSKLFDRETFCCINMSIMSWDYGKPRQNFVFYNFTFNFLDENDNSPKFEKSKYDLYIYEGNQPQQIIAKLNASDPDLGDNGQIAFSIRDTETLRYFSIDASGTLRALRTLDREHKSHYKFIVYAVDNGNPSLWSTADVVVNVMDINDNPPKILYKSAFLSREQLPNKNTIVLKVDENAPLDTIIVRFSAEDADEGDSGMARFSIKPKSSSSPSNKERVDIPFSLSQNGVLTVSGLLDREKIESYEFTVICQDLGLLPLSSELIVLVYISDINDNCPQLIGGVKNAYINKDEYFSVRNDSKPKILFQINYTDADFERNRELKFDLLTYSEYFHVNENIYRVQYDQLVYTVIIKFKNIDKNSSSTQVLYTSMKLGKYVLRLKISDYGDPSCSIYDNLVLVVGDNHTNKNQILTMLKNIDKMSIESKYLVNDDETIDEKNANNTSESDAKSISSKSKLDVKTNKKSKAIFTNGDYLLLVALIAIVVIIAIFFSLLGTVYFYSRYNKLHKTNTQNLNDSRFSRKESESTIVRSEAKTLLTNSDMNVDNTEILYNDNRFSLSVKSTESEQSNSADSVASSGYTKETKSTTSSRIEQAIVPNHNNNLIINKYSVSTFNRLNEPPLSTKRCCKNTNHNPYNHNNVRIINSNTLDNRLLNNTIVANDYDPFQRKMKHQTLKYKEKIMNDTHLDEDALFLSYNNHHNHHADQYYDYKSSAV